MKKIKKIFTFMPFVVFLLIALAFYAGLKRENPDELPSVLIGNFAPKLNLTPLGEKEIPTVNDLKSNEIKFVNFWASWCLPCRAEHDIIKVITDSGYKVIGVNYKDKQKNALLFLDELGDPFFKVGSDTSGRTGINWGLYGIPETFILDSQGKVLLRHPGPITLSVFENKFLPLIKK